MQTVDVRQLSSLDSLPQQTARRVVSASQGRRLLSAPTITDISPLHVPVDATSSNMVVIAGTNFGSGSNVAVSIGSKSLASSDLYQQFDEVIIIKMHVAKAIGNTLDISVTSQTSSTVSVTSCFSYDAPTVTHVSPPVAAATGGSTLTIYGENYGVEDSPAPFTDGSCASS